MKETLSQKLFVQKDGKKFAYTEDIKKSIRELKEEYTKFFSHNRPTCEWFEELIEKIFGKELVE